MSGEWWPELGPKWEPTKAVKPACQCIDIHAHLAVRESSELATPHFKPEMDPRTFFSPEESIRYNNELRRQPEQVAKFHEPEARIADMDRQGIDMQLLSVVPYQYFYWLEPDLAVRACRIQHERFAEVVASYPDRFAAVANLPMAYPDLACEIMEEAKRDFGFHGFEMNADVLGADLDDRKYDQIWEKAVELDMTAIMHPQGFTHGQRMDDYYLVNVVCMPLASTLAVSRMILGGVWERIPDFRLLVVHGGGYLPYYFARTDHAYTVRPELRRHITRKPSEYLHQLYFDTTVFEPGMVEYLIEEFGDRHVLLGTDYPFDMGPTDPLDFLAGVKMTEESRHRILGANAARLFKIGE